MKGDNVRKKMNKRKIMFSDIINYISLEDDETSSISSSRVPTTPTKAKTQNTVPTTPRKVRMSQIKKGLFFQFELVSVFCSCQVEYSSEGLESH